jgi:hypothetical protein
MLHSSGSGDVDMVAFAEATSIIGGHDAVEEFLACGIWPLREGWEFEVERKETTLLKVVVPMPKVIPIIGKQEPEVAFKARIVATANLLAGNDSILCLSWLVCSVSLVWSPLCVSPRNGWLLL